ncbi:hypothetical protein FVR03_09640 [Pontibacter qinzhouensis]|uniref:DUF3575 domain-containing protein n=1 Tax=Pontibacter qinzhouensis TaxID=2603253 RepID=A0A5C8K910_9BACT|nr:hypothetical protein [Pontibacter qinzhouensis]TXK47448.1 hypothetical protein FVR03_09640 [Pontibacter qinzhouensis]
MFRIWFTLWLLVLSVLPLTENKAQQYTEFRNSVTVKAFGLSVHLKESPYPEIFPNRLDNKGYTTLNFGGIIGYDRFLVRNDISVRVEQGFYADCAASMAGFSHVGFRAKIFRSGRHSVNGGIGPTLVYRHDWNRLEQYIDDGYFKKRGDWQYKFYWYGGEFEYNYQLSAQNDLSLTLIPGIPELISIGIGFRRRY